MNLKHSRKASAAPNLAQEGATVKCFDVLSEHERMIQIFCSRDTDRLSITGWIYTTGFDSQFWFSACMWVFLTQKKKISQRRITFYKWRRQEQKS